MLFSSTESGGISASENVYYTVSSALTPMRTNPRLLISQTTKQHLQPVLSQEQLLQQPHQLKANHSCSEYGQNQVVLKQCELGLYSKETRYNDKRDHMSGQLTPQNTHTVVPSDSQQLMNNEIQDDCCQGTMSQDLGQKSVSSDWVHAGCSMNSIDPELSNLSTKGPEQITENIKYYQQLKWLILLNHANSCQGPPSCKFQYCVVVRDILKHIKNCQVEECSYRYCRQSKMVISHSRNCVNKHCPVCYKAKESLRLYSKQSNKCSNAEPMEPYTIERTLDGVHDDRMDTELSVGIETFDDQPPISKRIRQSVYPDVSDSVDVHLPRACSEFALQKGHPKHVGQDNFFLSKQEPNMNTDMLPPQKSEIISVGAVGKMDTVQSYVTPGAPSKLDSQFEQGSWLREKDKNEDVPDISKNINCSAGAMLSKTGKTKAKVISLMEIFTPEQVYEHIRSIRQWYGQVYFLT
jgi:E1A/CREB-binding protein